MCKTEEERSSRICEQCKLPYRCKFPAMTHPARFCSRRCLFGSMSKKVEKACAYCEAPFKVSPSHAASTKFCSVACRKAAQTTLLDCIVCENQVRIKPYRAGAARYCSHVCKAVDQENFACEKRRLRNSPEYGVWRDAVYVRDDYTCQFCGKRGGKLEADHIKQFAFYPDLRFDVDNGRTLCVPCHDTVPIAYNRRQAVEVEAGREPTCPTRRKPLKRHVRPTAT